MQPAGLEVFRNRKKEKSKVYSFESGTRKFAENYENKFRTNKEAWTFFTTQAPSYQNMIIHWVMTAKQEKTRLSRLDKIMSESKNQKRLFR
jgi:uncharacterized protein YdeI (YjbR/CyaY-like superfamily)